MKLHLPTMLRKALLACFAAVSSFTFATGSAWADTYDLLANQDSWAFTSGRGNASWENGAIKARNWNQSIATYHAASGQVYNVDTTTNTLTFTITYNYTNANGSAVGNAFQEFALVGNTQAIVLGTPKYQTTDGANDANQIGYATSTNTTADVYATKAEGWSGIDFATVTFTPFEGVTRQEGTYTLTGVVTKGETNYTLDVSLAYGEEAAVTYVDDFDLGATFDINKVIMANDGPVTTLTALTIEGSYANMPTVTLEGNSTNDNRLINTPLTHRIILNMDGQNNDYLYASGNGNVYTIANDVEIQSAIINNGNGNTTYKFTGTITGTGEFKRPSGADTDRQHYEFSGDMRAYSGNMSLLDNSGSLTNGDTLLFNGNTSGTGTITISGYNQMTVAGATMKNSEISATYLTISGASSFAGDVTVSTLLSIGADAAITLGADASLTLGGGALIDLANATYTADALGNRTYSFLASGSTGTHNLADLSAAMIKDAALGYEYAFADGAITMTLATQHLSFGGGNMTWNDETDNTPFTNAENEAAAFSTGDSVTFNGSSTAGVTLGEDVLATQVMVDAGATVNLSGGDYTLNAADLTVNGTLSVETGTVKPTAYSIGEAGELLVKSGAVLDFTAIDNQVIVGDNNVDEFSALNNDKIKTESGGYVKIAFKHSESEELKLHGDVTQAMNIEAVGAMVIHGNGASRSYTIGEGKELLANGSSNSLQGLEAINKGIIAIAGGKVETNKLTLGHSSENNNGDFWGKLAMTDGTLKIGNLTLRQNHNDEFSVTGGELEFTTSTALTRGSNTRATITIQGTGAGDSQRVTLKSATSAWALDGAGLTTAPTIGNVTVEAAQDISLSNVALSGAIVKQGVGKLVLNTVNTDALSSMDIRQGYVTSATALTLSALTVAEGAGFAYDLGTTPALITAADYSGALTLNLSNVAVGDYTLFQGAAGLSADDINIEGVDDRLSVTKNVIDGLVSINIAVAGDALQLVWDTAGADNVWSNGGAQNWDSDSTPGADTSFADGDSVTFAGEGEEITISGDVAPAAVTVSGSGYAFAGSGKITGAASLTVENGGVLEIKSAQRYTGGTVVQAGGELILSTGGGSGALKGDIDVYGTLKLNANDATGWGNGADVVGVINVYEDGLLSATTTANLTGSGIDINLTGGSVTGIAGSNLDLCYGGDARRWSEINALAADGATADNPTVSTISGVGLSLRQDATIITVEENAQLQISGAIHQKGDRPNGGSGQIPEGAVAGLNKAGAGELVLSGNNTYTQATTVAVGTLTLADGGVLNSAVTVNEGATFRLESGSTYGAASIGGAGSVVKTGSGIASLTATTTIASLDIQEGYVQTGAEAATISTLTVANGAGFVYDLAAAGQKKVVAESFDGPITLKLISLANGTFELMQGAAGLDASDVTFDYTADSSRLHVTESVENGLAKLTVSIDSNLDNLVWNDAHADNEWVVAGVANWTSGGATEQFFNGDSVTFSGTGEAISIVGTVQPAAITISGTGYSFVGDGSISGAGALTVAAGAEATISTINTFTGGTTIEEGATLTITQAKALSTYNNMDHSTVLGKVSGAGTLVINLDSETSEAVAKGSGDSANMGSFTGVVDVQRGHFYVGEQNNGTNAGAETVFNASKVIVRADGALWTHFGGSGRTLTSAIDLMSGAELRNRDGNPILSGNIRFNIVDSAAATPSYDSEGVVLMTQYWNKTIELSGLLEGDGTVQMKTPETGGKGAVKLTGENNTFAGTYEVVQGGDNNFDLRLGSQTAAQFADIKLSATNVNVYLLLDSDAIINGLYGVVDGENAVQAQGGNRTLTVSEGDFGALIMDSGSNVLSLTKQGTGTLVLRGANIYTGATTINGGTLELAEGASMGTTAITMAADGTFKVNAGTYANSITGTGTIAKAGTGAATLSGIDAAFAGTIDVQGGTLNAGSALEIGTGRVLKAGANGAVLSSALTLAGGTYAVDYSAEGAALGLSNLALTLAGGTVLDLSGLVPDTEQETTIDLLTGVGSLLGSDGHALELTGAMASSYFNSITGLGDDIDTTTLGLQLADGKLQLVIPEQTRYLVWGEGTGTWEAGQDFTADDVDFTADADVKFGELTGESDTVSISGAIAAGKVLIEAGEGKTYVFSAADDASGIASAERITVDSGTASFGAGTLDMTADTTLAVNDGATLSLANGAITNAGAVDIVLNDGSTLEWETGNTTDYSANMTINGDVTLVSNGTVNAPVFLQSAIAGMTSDSATTLVGHFSVKGAEVLTGTISLDENAELRLKNEGNSNVYSQNFTGEGDLRISSGATVILSGTNDYSGTTIFDHADSKLIVQGAQALSTDTSFNNTAGSLFLSKAAGAETETYNIASDYSTLKGELSIGLNEGDGGPVSGVTLNLGSTGKLGGNVVIKAGNAMDWAAGATVGGTVYVVEGAELTLRSAVANTITYGGTVKIAGDFTWDNTGKTYTGETQVLAGSTLTAAAPLSSGTGSKVQLMADEEADTVGTLVITNSANWTNKVYGAGTLVLVNTVSNLDAIVDTTSTLGTLQVGDATTSGVLVINSSGTEAASNVVQHLIVTEGSNLSLNRTSSTNTLGVNLTLSGAGDATATAGTAEAAALSIYHNQGGTKTIDSNISLDGDTTVYVHNGGAWLSGQFDSNGHTLTKTGNSWLGLNGSSIDLSGGADIQSGTLEVNHNATTALEIGAVNMAAGTALQLKGLYELTDGLSVAGTTTIYGNSSATVEVSSVVTGADDAVIQLTNFTGVTFAGATMKLAEASPFEGTWNIRAGEWTVQLAHAEAAAKATLSYDASTQLKLMDGPAEAPISTYQVAALKSSVAGASIVTEGETRKTLAISNALTDVAAATYKGSVAGTVSVQLGGGVQKFTGTLGDTSSYVVSDGTLAIGSTNQTGSHDFAAWGGVLDMTGYTRAANATGNDLITAIMAGQIHGLNLGAGMTLSDVLTATDAVTGSSIEITATDGIVTLGGNTVLGAGQMNFRVTDSVNLNEGADGAPYKLADTHYAKGTNSSDVLTLQGNNQLTHLVISVDNITTDVMDPTPEEQGGRYRDHLLISGIATTDSNNTALGALVDGKLDATGYFTMNLQNVGSTKYELLFVQNAADNTLYDLVLRASGMADTLFWNTAENGVWAAADQTPDAWLLAEKESDSTSAPWIPTDTTADFEQYDMVIFDDLMGADGTTPLAQVELTTEGDVQIGKMTVQADTTNYIINGSISSAEGNTGATLTKTGAATLTLTGANSYAGDTTISGGTIIAQHEAALSNTTVHVDGTTLVLDYEAAADGDGVFDATVQLDSYGGRDLSMLRSLSDAEVNAKIEGARAKQLQAAADATLTINLVQDAVNGTLQVNENEDMTGTVVMDLAANKTHAHAGGFFVFQGELVLTGESTTRWNSTDRACVQEGATLRVQGGMTLQTTYLEGANGTYGTISLEDASNLVLTAAGARTVRTAIESEGATLSATGANAVMTVTDLTIKGEDGADGLNRTLLSGGTWVLNAGAVTWDSAATAALAVGANTTVKVNDDTMKNLRVANTGAVLTTAKAGSVAAELSVEKVNVSAGGAVSGVNLTITGTGSMIQGAVAGVTVNQAGTVDLTGTPALTFGSGAAGSALRAGLASLDILSGCVQVPALNNPVMVTSGSVNINGANALLDLSGANRLTKADGTTAADITINAGGIQGAQTYNGLITVDDKGTVLTDGITLKNLSNAATVKLASQTVGDTAVTTLKGMQGLTLADGATLTLSSLLEEGKGNLLFDFADAPTGTLKVADGAKVTIDVNDVLGDVLDAAADSVTYTLADADATGLATGTVFDAALKLYNLKAEFTADGNLVLSRTSTPLSDDDIYRSSEDNVDGTQWAGNGPDVYASSEPYASVYIDKDTVIDLTGAAPGAEQAADGLVLSNLIGRGNGANLTIEGDGDDMVTINNNLAPSDVDKNVKALSFNGDIDVTGTDLQIKNTVATPGAPNAGGLDPESVYLMNGALTTDEDSKVIVTAGILKLNGKGSNAGELLGGVLVESGMGLLQVSGEASVGGDLSIGETYGEDTQPDAEIVSGGKLTLLDGATVKSGFDIHGEGEGKETLSIARDAVVVMEDYTATGGMVLELQEGAKLTLQDAPDTPSKGASFDLDGLMGSGAIVNEVAQGGQEDVVITITPQGDSTFSGDLSRYEGVIHVADGVGSQRFDKVTTTADSKVDMILEGQSVINVAEEAGNKTLNLGSLMFTDGSDTTVEMNTDSEAPVFRINSESAMSDGAALTLSSAVGEVLGADDDLLLMEGVGQGDVSDMDGKSITLDITDNAFRRLSETAKLVVEGDKVYVDLVASETNRYEESASDPNAKAGAELLWNVDPSKLPADSALKAIDNAVAELMQNGNRDAAERALAATAGAGTAVLGSAFSADVERQLRAIRNRTTTMGVNQCEVNEGMPYVNAWINAEGDHRELDADGLAAGYTMDSWGGTVGFDVDITNHLTMGMAVTAMYGDLEADSADRAEGDFDTQYVSFFARVAHQAWTHTFVATLGRADVTLNRTVSVPGGSYETSGDTDGMAYGFMYEVARTFSLSEDGSTCWQPVFNVAWRHSSIDAYTESGADNALAVGEQDMNVLTFGAGARLQTVMGENLYNRASIFEARAMVKVDAGDREGEADVALLEGTTSASVKSAEIGAVGVEIGAGITIPVGLNAGSIFIDGSAEFRSGYSNVNGTVGYRINF